MLRRQTPLILLALVAAISACDSYSGTGGGGKSPIGIMVMDARTKGVGYTTYPRVNFYSTTGANFVFSTLTSDTCVTGPYDTTTAPITETQIGGGAFLLATVSGNIDTLYKATTGDKTYLGSTLTGVPFVPGDSVSVQIGGDVAGFPPLSTIAPTAEPFAIVRPGFPTNGNPMIVSWTPAIDNTAAMYVSFRYNTGGGTAINTQIFCDFHDDGQGTVQAYLIPALQASSVPFVMAAQRVRSALATTQIGTVGYLNVISLFEVPTPVSP